MLTILLEVKSNSLERRTNNFYNPATKDFKKYPRSENGISKAIKDLSKTAQSNNWIEDYRFVIYKGKYNHYNKDMQPMFIVDKTGNVVA